MKQVLNFLLLLFISCSILTSASAQSGLPEKPNLEEAKVLQEDWQTELAIDAIDEDPQRLPSQSEDSQAPKMWKYESPIKQNSEQNESH